MNPRLIVDALQILLTGRAPPTLPSGVVTVATRHRVSGALHHMGVQLGERDAQAAEAAWARNVAAHLSRRAAVQRIWPDGAPPPLVIKGADIAENLFDDPGARAANDLDLVLPDLHFRRVEPGLVGARRPAPRYERYAHESPCAVGVEVDGVLVELHRELAPPHRNGLRAAALWHRAVPGDWGGFAVRWPRPVDRLLVWLANAAKDAFYLDLAALLDLALILRDLGALDSARWSDWRLEAATMGLGRPFDLALHRLEQSGLWPAPLPVAPPVVRRLATLLPPVLTGRIEPPQGRFQVLKLALCDADRWPGMVGRGLATTLRR